MKIVQTLCKKNGNYTIVNKGVKYTININKVETLLYELQIDFDDDYIAKVILKYYHV